MEANSDGAFFSRLVDTATTLRARRIEVRRIAGALGVDSATMADAKKTDTLASERLMESVEPRIRVALDLFGAMRRPAETNNLVLENGDSLHVPKSVQTVEVRGAVNEPTALAHTGRRLGNYVSAAGGTTEAARERRTYVIQPNGGIQSRRRFLGLVIYSPTPRPGATVVVPERTALATQGNSLATITIMTQFLASLAAIVALSR